MKNGNKPATVGDLINYLSKIDPKTPVVQTNSLGWFNHDIEELKVKDIKKHLYLERKATKDGVNIDGNFFVIYDRMLCDY